MKRNKGVVIAATIMILRKSLHPGCVKVVVLATMDQIGLLTALPGGKTASIAENQTTMLVCVRVRTLQWDDYPSNTVRRILIRLSTSWL